MINAPKNEKKEQNYSRLFISFSADSTLAGVARTRARVHACVCVCVFFGSALTLHCKSYSHWPSVKSRKSCCHHSICSAVFTRWQMSRMKWRFPFTQLQSAWQTNGQTAEPPKDCIRSCLVKSGPTDFTKRCYLIPTTGDVALQFQAPRMISESDNPVGRPTQTRTELIAARNTLPWRLRKCRRALANRKKNVNNRRARLLLWTPSWLLLPRLESSVHKSQLKLLRVINMQESEWQIPSWLH